MDPNAPSLVIAFGNGRIQMMRSDTDERPVLVDTGMTSLCAKWNPDGTILAVSGVKSASAESGGKELAMVQFYNPYGDHLRTLKVPGNSIAGVTWEGTGLRLALAVESFIYFANVRPDYLWGFFRSTLVYAFPRPEKREHCVVFWDTESDDKYTRFVKKLVAIRAAGENCVLISEVEDEATRSKLTAVTLCNAIGGPVDTKYVDIKPQYVAMTATHVAVASEQHVYLWQYRTSLSKVNLNSAALAREAATQREQMWHVDDTGYTTAAAPERYVRPAERGTSDAIAAIAMSDRTLILGRESGSLLRFSLPSVSLDARHVLRCRPQAMAINCNSSMLSIIDIGGILTFFDLDARSSTAGQGATGEHLAFERKDAWDMCWSDDNPELFAMTEKTRMYVFRRMQPEEPVSSSAYIAGFSDLKIRAVLLDDIMQSPEAPNKV